MTKFKCSVGALTDLERQIITDGCLIRRIYTYTEDTNLPGQHLRERLGIRWERLFMAFVSFVNQSDGTPLYENTVQYAILKKEWEERKSHF